MLSSTFRSIRLRALTRLVFLQVRNMSGTYKHILSHYDPAVGEMQKALELAKSTGASQEVINTITSALNMVEWREEFAHTATTKESDACENIVRETYEHDFKSAHEQGKTTWLLNPRMMTGPLEGQFLKSLVSMQGARRILDIGMFTGYSALSMAEALPADGEMVSVDMDEYLRTLTGSLFQKSPHHKKIKIVIGKASDVLKQMAADKEQFDMMFLDADKSGYLEYFKLIFEHNLLKKGGTILVDNAFMHGDGYLPSRGSTAAKRFVEAVVADKSLHSILVPIRDGVIIIRRKSDVEGGVA